MSTHVGRLLNLCIRLLCVASTLGAILPLGTRGVPNTQDLTLDSFLHFPNRKFLTGSTQGGEDQLAWVEVKGGIVNVLCASAKQNWTIETAYTSAFDLGLDVTQLVFQNKSLYYSVGPTADSNPTSSTTLPFFSTFVTFSICFTTSTFITFASGGFQPLDLCMQVVYCLLLSLITGVWFLHCLPCKTW